MKHIAIVFQSKYGQTAKIANYLQGKFATQGVGVQILEIKSNRDDLALEPQIDAVIVGTPVYAQKYPSAIVGWTRKHLADLNQMPIAFFSVSLNAADQRPASRAADVKLLKSFVRATGLKPDFVASISGALKYTEYNFFIRWVMKLISRAAGGPTDTAKDYEMTDWTAVDRFADAFIAGGYSKEFSAERLYAAPERVTATNQRSFT